MKVLFLDIDGVLNTPSSSCLDRDALEADKVERVKTILRETGADLVVSSDWRFLRDTEGLLLGVELVPYMVRLDATIVNRLEAAEQFLQAFPAESWIALDDRKEYWDGRWDRLVWVNGKIGLTDRDVQMAIRLLNDV